MCIRDSYNHGESCILCSVESQVFLNNLNISENFGDFSVVYLLKTATTITDGLNFVHNRGSFIIMNSGVSFSGFTLFKNCTQMCTINTQGRLEAEGTVTAIQSSIKFYDNITFCENFSKKSGGDIYVSESKVSVHGNIYITNNEAEISGGGAFLYISTLICHGNCSITGNRANRTGGGIQAVGAIVSLSNHKEEYYSSLTIIDNEAEYGGGLYFEVNSKLIGFENGHSQYKIDFSGNIARASGGAIFIRDETYLGTCNSTSYMVYQKQTECFLQALYSDVNTRHSERKHSISFENNTAARGSVLYGGLLDRCTVSPMADIYKKSIHRTQNTHIIDGLTYFLNESELNSLQNATDEIASDAARICFCQDNTMTPNCSYKLPTIHIEKGENFNITLVVVDQVNHTINATIRSLLARGTGGILGEGQQLQHTYEWCTNLNFNISSPHNLVNLVLYADKGPCKDRGLSSNIVEIKFKNCSCLIGFLQSNRTDKCECLCDPQLEKYVTVFNSSSFTRTKNVWINYTTNGSGYMYFIHPNCPYDYCLPPSYRTINLNEPNGADAQCNYNRSGLLCGQCKEGYSLSEGTMHCIQCPKHWSGLAVTNVLIGIVSGVILVLLFLILNLTVALGTINGIVFYANVMYVNRSLFLPFPNRNFFSVFIHLLNTQSTIERCFYEGMDCLLYTSPSPRDATLSRMPSSA